MAKVSLITTDVSEKAVSDFLADYTFDVVEKTNDLLVINVESYEYGCELAAVYYDCDISDLQNDEVML